jgi:hypothetical protein
LEATRLNLQQAARTVKPQHTVHDLCTRMLTAQSNLMALAYGFQRAAPQPAASSMLNN